MTEPDFSDSILSKQAFIFLTMDLFSLRLQKANPDAYE